MKRAADWLNRLSIEHIWVMVVVVGIIAFLNTHPVLPHDFWWHMAVGRQILETGQIPQVDTFSYTASGLPYPSYNQFWLMEVVLYSVYQAGGIILVILFQTVVVTSAYLLVLRLAYRRSQNWRAAAFALLFAAAMGFDNWNVRPQAVTFLYAALLMTAIEALKNRFSLRWLAVFPLVMALWVNSHGTFLLGFALLGIWGLESLQSAAGSSLQPAQRSLRPLWLPAAASGLAFSACLLNPTGLGFVRYLGTMAGSPIIQNFTREWQPPSFDTLPGTIFFAGLLLLALLLAASPKRPSLGLALAFLIFGALGLKYIRGVVWFGLVLAPYAAEHLSALIERSRLFAPAAPPTPASRRINLLFAGVLLLLGVLSLPWFKSSLPLAPEKAALLGVETPVAATSFLMENKLPGQLFHAMPYGSYLVWAAQPVFPVFVDSRLELYPEQVWADYFSISAASPGWEDKLATYGVRTLLLERSSQEALITAAGNSPEWLNVYADGYSVILVRK